MKAIRFGIFIVLLPLIGPQLSSADVEIYNGHETQRAWVVYSRWLPADNTFPSGWRTTGWYSVEPGELRTLAVPSENRWVYLYIAHPYPTQLLPEDVGTRNGARFWMHPNRAFTAVENSDGTFLASNREKNTLIQKNFYVYRNGERITLFVPQPLSVPGTFIKGVKINTTHVRQIGEGQPGQEGAFRYTGDNHFVLMEQYDNTCGTTSAEMLLHYYGKDVTQSDIWREGDIDTVDAGAWPGEIRSALRGLGVYANWYHRLTVDDLKRYVRTSRPPIILLRFGDFLHYVVIVGYDAEDNFLIADPNGVFRWMPSADLRKGWSLNSPGIPNTRYSVQGLFKNFALKSLTFFANAGLKDNNAIVPSTAPTHHFQPNWSEMQATLIVGDKDWNPFFKTRRWERTFTFSNNFNSYRVAALKPFLWEEPSSWGTRAYMQGTQADWQNHKVRTWGHIEYGRVTRGHLWIIVRTYRHPKASTVAAAPAAPTPQSKLPTTTALLPNYPNPSNPETWIPYQLATPAQVRVSIHTVDGQLVRTLELGKMPAGLYADKTRAAYWNGRNQRGEPVATGLYFYTLKAGDFSATKKMLIRK